MEQELQNILEIINKYPKEMYNQIIAQKKSWEILYHLSDLRENVLAWYPITSDMEVLEIGAECGAVTGLLSEKAAKVTCVEESKEKLQINQKRHRDRTNIQYRNIKIKEELVSVEGKFDLITVLENYDRTIILSRELLEQLNGKLKKNGVLILGVGNPLGMKSWAGHRQGTKSFFADLEGNGKQEALWTKYELEQLLKESGLNQYEFYYPYPDYYFMNSLYSDEHIPKKGELKTILRNFDQERWMLFDEEKVMNTIIDAHLFEQFSDFYLVAAKKGE